MAISQILELAVGGLVGLLVVYKILVHLQIPHMTLQHWHHKLSMVQ